MKAQTAITTKKRRTFMCILEIAACSGLVIVLCPPDRGQISIDQVTGLEKSMGRIVLQSNLYRITIYVYRVAI